MCNLMHSKSGRSRATRPKSVVEEFRIKSTTRCCWINPRIVQIDFMTKIRGPPTGLIYHWIMKINIDPPPDTLPTYNFEAKHRKFQPMDYSLDLDHYKSYYKLY